MATKSKRQKKSSRHSVLTRLWRRYEYKHTTLSIISVAIFVMALDTALVQAAIEYVRHLSWLGVFVAGLLYTSFFTAAPAIALLIALSGSHNALLIGLLGGIGSMLGDFIILKIFEERIAYELRPLVKKLHLGSMLRRLRRKKERERSLLLGMVVLASPLPDELGIALMGLSRFRLNYLLLIAYVMNALGIMVVVLAAQL